MSSVVECTTCQWTKCSRQTSTLQAYELFCVRKTILYLHQTPRCSPFFEFPTVWHEHKAFLFCRAWTVACRSRQRRPFLPDNVSARPENATCKSYTCTWEKFNPTILAKPGKGWLAHEKNFCSSRKVFRTSPNRHNERSRRKRICWRRQFWRFVSVKNNAPQQSVGWRFCSCSVQVSSYLRQLVICEKRTRETARKTCPTPEDADSLGQDQQEPTILSSVCVSPCAERQTHGDIAETFDSQRHAPRNNTPTG